jgi:hypothetical protein
MLAHPISAFRHAGPFSAWTIEGRSMTSWFRANAGDTYGILSTNFKFERPDLLQLATGSGLGARRETTCKWQ